MVTRVVLASPSKVEVPVEIGSDARAALVRTAVLPPHPVLQQHNVTWSNKVTSSKDVTSSNNITWSNNVASSNNITWSNNVVSWNKVASSNSELMSFLCYEPQGKVMFSDPCVSHWWGGEGGYLWCQVPSRSLVPCPFKGLGYPGGRYLVGRASRG